MPAFGDDPGYSLDVMRHDPDAQNGVTEFLIAKTAEGSKERGVSRLSMNFAAWGRLFHAEGERTLRQRVARWVVGRLNPFFQIQSLYDFNAKFDPDWLPRVILVRGERRHGERRRALRGRRGIPERPGDRRPARAANGHRGTGRVWNVKAKALGFNHVALEVGSIDEALAFYGALFDLRLRGRSARMAFIDMGDQFLALSAGRTQPPDVHRHVGLVVDDVKAVRRALEEVGADILPGRGLDFLDPWGNHFQVVAYEEIQFLKAPEVLRVLGADGLRKTDAARAELRAKGIDLG